MAKNKIVVTPIPMRIDSGHDVGISLRLEYSMVEPDAPGYDLFDPTQLDHMKTEFIARNETKFTFTYEPHGIKAYTRVFAESKFEKE
jgi:hypothetical protein